MKALVGLLTILLIGRTSAFTASCSSLRSVYPNSSIRSRNRFTTLIMAKRVLVPIADDSEEIETTCITDTLARFGAEVVVASVKPGGELVCKMSRGVKVRSSRCSYE